MKIKNSIYFAIRSKSNTILKITISEVKKRTKKNNKIIKGLLFVKV